MRILDRYIWKEMLLPFCLGLVVFTFLLLVDKIFDLMDLIINKGVPVHLVGLLLAYIVPAFLVLTIPIGFLLAILVAFGRLSADMEVVALKASGVSPLRLLRPVAVFGLAAAGLTSLLMLEAVPRANYAFKSLIFDILRAQASIGIKERIFNDSFGQFVIYVEEMAPDQIELRNIFVSDEQNRHVTLRLQNGTVHETVPRTFDKYRQIRFREYDLRLTFENPLVRQGEAPKGDREMTLRELGRHAALLGASGGNPNPYLVEMHKKHAIPVACLVFTVVGVPLGIRAHRAGRWAAFVLLLPIVLFYYVALSVGETLGDAGRVPPWLAMWAPNLVMGAIGTALLWSTLTERRLPLERRVTDAAWRGWHAGVRTFGRARSWGARLGWWRPAPRRRTVAAVRRRVRVGPAARRSNALHLVDRYLTREYLTLFGYGLAFATVVVLVADLMTTLDRYLRVKPSLLHVLEHFLYRTPPFVYQGLHLVVLMATILLFLALSRSHELTALKAGGVSLYRVSRPVFGLALLVTLGSLGFQEFILPILNQKAVEVDETKIKRRTLPQLRKRTDIWYRGREGSGTDGRIYHIDLLDPQSRQLSGVSILEFGPGFTVQQRWDARRMRFSEARQRWDLEAGTYRRFDPSAGEVAERFEAATLAAPERFADFARVPRAPEVMNYAEFRAYIRRLEASGHRVSKYLVDLHAKLAFPVAHLIMALVGIPFALQSPRAGRVIGIALGLGLGLSYFLVHSAAVALARAEILPPIVAAWAANVLFTTLGLYLYLRAPT